MKLLHCAVYLSVTGIIGFLAGRIFPKRLLRPEQGLFRPFGFEKNGKIYDGIGIRHWQNRLPDMSRILPFMMPPKKLSGDPEKRLPDMIREMCIAELTHLALCISGLYCLKLWPGVGGIAVVLIYILLLNLPFILIQRYNRPRCLQLLRRYSEKEKVCVH